MAVLARAIPAAERLARIIAATRRVLARAYD
jgi:hypothetical protein